MSIAVIEKTFRVLETLSRFEEPVPLLRLASSVKLPKPTAYRILQSLAGLGYVAQETGSGHYFTTDRLAGLALRDPHHDLKELARPVMEQLHAWFDETVNLGVLEDLRVRYVSVIETSRSLRWVVRPGRSDPFYCTALGRAIAACLPDAERARCVERVKTERVTARTVTERKAIAAILDDVRRRGWAIEEEETAAGVGCLAMPLEKWGAPHAAISVSVPINRFTAGRRRELVGAFRRLKAQAEKERRLRDSRSR